MADTPTNSTNNAQRQVRTSEEKSIGALNPKLIDAVDVTLEAFLGSSSMTVGKLLALKTGETVELDASLGRAVELRLNGMPIARGELVAAGDKFAVRLTEISK